MIQRIMIELGERSYPAWIGRGLTSRTEFLIPLLPPGRRCAVITDSVVGPLHATTLLDTLRIIGARPVLLTVPSGEQSKSMECAASLCEQMAAASLDRKSLVLALGGGVVGDLAGFVAAIYFRGIPFVQIPTTVLAQVDSSVGGKTGVNLAAGKNLVGSFHQPSLVLADTATLDTLPDREFREGFAEIIKHAIIRDSDLFASLQSFERSDAAALDALIRRNIGIKAAIVQEDEHETLGIRALLNFGHTIGHGIENAAGYGTMLHGEAISLGLVAAARLSARHAGMPAEDVAAIIALLEKFRLPTLLPDTIPTHAIVEAMQRDKKFVDGSIRFVLSPGIGSALVSDQVSSQDMISAIEQLRI